MLVAETFPLDCWSHVVNHPLSASPRGSNDLSSDLRTEPKDGLVDTFYTCRSIDIQVSIMFHMIYDLQFLNQSMERSARSHWKRTRVMSFKFQPIQHGASHRPAWQDHRPDKRSAWLACKRRWNAHGHSHPPAHQPSTVPPYHHPRLWGFIHKVQWKLHPKACKNFGFIYDQPNHGFVYSIDIAIYMYIRIYDQIMCMWIYIYISNYLYTHIYIYTYTYSIL